MNPLKAADAGVLRSAVVSPERDAPSPPTPLDAVDWIRSGAYSPQLSGNGRVLDQTAGLALVLVDADAASRAARRALLGSGGAARVITAADEYDVGDALRLIDPDAVIVSVSDSVLGAKLVRAVRAQFEDHHEAMPVLVWQSRLMLQGTPAALLDAGADALLDDGTAPDAMLAAVRALRRALASATRRSARDAAPSAVLLDALQSPVALVGADGRVLEANDALQVLWRELTGQRVSPVEGDLTQLLVPTERAVVVEGLRAVLDAAPGAVTEMESTMGVSPMRGIPVLLRLVRLDAASPAPVVLVQVTDLRERRKSEELVRSNRWRALDRQQMLDLSARLRNVLSALSQAVGAIDRVRTGGDVVLSSTHAAMLRGSLAQSELLLDGLQALATEQEHAAALVELRALVSTQLALFRQMLPPQVQLTWAVGESDVMVRGSETQLQQVLTALVMNAWDAQRSGGAIHVSVQYTDDVVVVAVEDEGPGVPEEQADWIFLPMTSTRSAEGASGLGLSTARRAAEMHGGQLRLDRTRTAGARFELILPRYRSRAPEVRPQPRATPLVRSDAGI